MAKKIAILGPLGLPIPPPKQGGIEWMVYYLVEGLIKKGYKVLLFAPKGTKTSAELVEVCDKPIAAYKITSEAEASRRLRIELSVLIRMKQEALKRKKEIAVVFNHTVNGGVFAGLEKEMGVRVYHVLHLPLYKEMVWVYKHFKSRLITISNNQRKPFPNLHYSTTIYNGIDLKKFPFRKEPKNYFLFSGKLREGKNPLDAILAANLAKEKLIIAGKINDKRYFKEKIKHRLKGNIRYVGEVPFAKIKQLYASSKALLFPINWEEPFGLVMIESMACGSPVIAFDKGSVREVIKPGKTGFIVKNVREMAQAMKNIDQIKREDCREWARKNFSVERMIDEYEKVHFKAVKR